MPATPRTPIRRFASHVGTPLARALPLTQHNSRTPGQLGAVMPFEKIGDEALDTKIAVRLTSAEKQQLEEDATAAGMSMSALVRSRYFGRKIKSRTDLTMVASLNRLVGMLKTVHNESDGAYSAETSAMLGMVADAIRTISKSRET